MTDETSSDTPGTEAGTAVADPIVTEEAGASTAVMTEEAPPDRLLQTVVIKEIGPCKKHITVTVERASIQHRLNAKYSELTIDSNVSGFRPGKAPRKIIEKRFEKDVSEQVKAELLLASLEQLAEEHDIAPLSAPKLDPYAILLPKEGPMVYEFEVEVRPQFDVPNYKGLKLRRPVRTFSDEDVAREERHLLAPYGQIVPKPEGNAQLGDIVIADIVSQYGSILLSDLKEISVRVDPQLAFKDGVALKFAEQMAGAGAGDTRTVDIQLSESTSDAGLRGKMVTGTFHVKEIKRIRLPELTPDFLQHFGVHSEAQLHEVVHSLLKRRLEHDQRQVARKQVLEQISVTTNWDLPRDLLIRHAKKAFARRTMEMRSDGIKEDEIKARQRIMEQDILASTASALKEHFVLHKIAELEKIDVDEDDLDNEIERIADKNEESPRRVKARYEKEDLLDALAAELIERKVLDAILSSAEYDDYPADGSGGAAMSTIEAQTVPGEMTDQTAEEPKLEPAAEAEDKPA